MDARSFWGQRYAHALIALLMIMAVVALGAYAVSAWKASRYSYLGPTTINVRGEGEVLAKPDIGTFSFSVLARAEEAAAAQSQSAAATNEIIAFLTGAGVAEEDIKTENYYLNPTYRYEDQVCIEGRFCQPGTPVIDGYEVSQMVSVKVRDLEQAGNLISGVGERGATNISSLQFTIDDETSLQATARAAAIADAQEKAEALARDLGVDIVRMTGYYEENNGYPIPYAYGGMEKAVASDAAITPQVPTGENVIRSAVNITYQVEG